ncbi:MAG: type III-B CRISPR-associated protein Cas10/Cmr2 [Bacteroidales bacterium]
MNKIYSAITIGPIYETLERARKTRALWASSYFFSWFMKNLIIRLKEKGYTILLPALKSKNPNDLLFHSKHGAGLYADRLYFSYDAQKGRNPNLIIQIIQEMILTASKELKKELKNELKIDNNYLSQYLNLHVVEIENNGGVFPLQELNEMLDLAELHLNAPLCEGDIHKLAEIFENIDIRSFLYNDAFENSENLVHNDSRIFPSLSEIATATLGNIPENVKEKLKKNTQGIQEDEELFKILNNHKIRFFPFHKYYALIYTDGDGIGSILAQLSKNKENVVNNLQCFSEKLFEFSKKSEEILYNYGGRLVYGGGDDLMALAPIVGKQENDFKTLFWLVNELDHAFSETMKDLVNELNMQGIHITIPTLSYGIMIGYYKHPLKEARWEAQELLSRKYKDGKNIVAIRFQKHSGQLMEAVIHKNNKQSWSKILELTQKNKYLPYYNASNGNEIKLRKNDLLSGIIHRLKDEIFETTLIEALKNNKLEIFIKNSFNESIHQNNDFLKEFKDLASLTFMEYCKEETPLLCEIQKFKNTLYVVLRYIHFINSDKE